MGSPPPPSPTPPTPTPTAPTPTWLPALLPPRLGEGCRGPRRCGSRHLRRLSLPPAVSTTLAAWCPAPKSFNIETKRPTEDRKGQRTTREQELDIGGRSVGPTV